MQNQNGFFKSEDASRYRIHTKKLQRMANEHKIERMARGLYLHPDYIEDPYYIMQYRAPKAVFSHESALYLHHLSDENPTQLTVTIPSGYNTELLKDKSYKFYYRKQSLWESGQREIESPFGNPVMVYSKERVLAEMIAMTEKTEKYVILNALKEGVREKKLNLLELMTYAKRFGTEEKMRNFLEILL